MVRDKYNWKTEGKKGRSHTWAKLKRLVSPWPPLHDCSSPYNRHRWWWMTVGQGRIANLHRERRALLNDGAFGHHQTFPSPVTRGRRQLDNRRRLPDGRRDHLRLLRRTINLVRHFPLNERLDWARHFSKRHTLLLLFLRLRSGLLIDVSLPLTVFHFCTQGDGKKELNRNYWKINKVKQGIGDGLMFACLFLVTTGNSCWLGTLTVLVQDVQGDKLLPHPLHDCLSAYNRHPWWWMTVGQRRIANLHGEGRALLNDGAFSHHQTLPNPVTRGRRQLGSRRRLPDGRRDHLQLLHQTINLVHHFPLNEQLDWARHFSRRHTLLLLFLRQRSGLLIDVSLPLTAFYFCTQVDGKKELNRNYWKINNVKQGIGDGLMFACLFFVTTGNSCWLRTLTVLVQGVQGDKLLPRLFF